MKQYSGVANDLGMKGQGSIQEIMELIMEFIPLYHQKFGALFHCLKDEKHPCTKNQNRAIMILKTHGRETPSRLGEYLDMEKGSLTSLVDSLEGMGLIRREADPSDRRKVWLSLTGEGRAYVDRRYRMFAKALSELFEPYAEPEVNRFKTCLSSVVDMMKTL